MAEEVSCFVAYPSTPPDRAESIEQAIERIKDGKTVEITGWKDLAVSGRLIIGTICEAIQQRDLFVADITSLNPNVLFELGFAIARRRAIWLLLNPTIERARAEFDRFALLTTIGYRPYSNSDDIVNGFYSDRPFMNLQRTLLDDLLEAGGRPNKRDGLLYIKPTVNTDAVIRISRRVDGGPMPSVIDEPNEMESQPLSWYAQEVDSSYAVVTHFISSEHAAWQLHNAKHALVSGLAYGLEKPLLMLAHGPYPSPLDYRDLMRTHRTAKAAEAIFDAFITPYLTAYEARVAAAHNYHRMQRARGDLRDIAIGDPIAEHESESVADYFISTAAYEETLKSSHSIVIGRKGAGKTATLYKLFADLSADPRNHFCTVRPVDYELEGVLAMIRQELNRSEKGYLVESFWKFLLYTELARSLDEAIRSKPNYVGKSPAEEGLLAFVEQHYDAIKPEFSSRLETVVEKLRDLNGLAGGKARRSRISELLHEELISKLRDVLGNVLSGKSKVVMLVDNLDKAWTRNADIELLSELLYGLLSVSNRIVDDFRRSASGLKPIKLHFTLFLRSDIYASMLFFAKERDKLPVRRLTWDDPESLLSVIEERFAKSGALPIENQTIWQRYFCVSVSGMPVQDYLVASIFPRPRDLIYLVKAALHAAVNRRHSKIEENDILTASSEYSRFAFNSFLAEIGALIPESEDLLMYFLQAPSVIDEEFVLRAMEKAQIPTDRLSNVIETLGDLTFFGFEIAPNQFAYLFDEQNTQKVRVMAEKTKEKSGLQSQRFQIHPAFYSFLEIEGKSGSLSAQLPMHLTLE
jgi:hypothetical protein